MKSQIPMTKSQTGFGFTLLEILVAMGVASILGVLVTQVFFTTTKSNTKTELLKDVKQNGEFALGIMERMIRNAATITSVCSATGTTLSSISIQNPDGNTTTFGCVLNNSVTRIASQSSIGFTEYLTSTNVSLGGDSCADAANSLKFDCTSNSGRSSRISIEYSLVQAGAQVDQTEAASATFQTTIIGRN